MIFLTYMFKAAARQRLSGAYFKTVLGAVVYYIPIYLMSMLSTVLMIKGAAAGSLAAVISAILNIFVVDVITVGFIRSLIDRNNAVLASEDNKRKYDINTVLSGFQRNFKNTVKVMFCKRLYLWGWEILTMVPIILCVGILAVLSYRPELSQLFKLTSMLISSPTEQMAESVIMHIYSSCMYVPYMFLGAVVLSVLLLIPYLRKMYEYEMIPMILAENPDISRKEAFAKTREIMHGYRFKYFLLQVSFIWLILAAYLVASIFMATQAMVYIIAALIMPYMYMTYVMFYSARVEYCANEANNAENTDDIEEQTAEEN